MNRFFIIPMLLIFPMLLLAQKKDGVIGKWLNQTGEGEITIYKKADQYFGKLSRIKAPNDEHGKPITDSKNPDKTLKNRPILGLEILKGFTYLGDNTYENGTVYDPKSGKTYSCKMVLNDNKLKIRGFIGISLLGRTEVWTRTK